MAGSHQGGQLLMNTVVRHQSPTAIPSAQARLPCMSAVRGRRVLGGRVSFGFNWKLLWLVFSAPFLWQHVWEFGAGVGFDTLQVSFVAEIACVAVRLHVANNFWRVAVAA